jgi:S-DNA-T family DNA segregation ATPase FtsK/SpoIIIE
MRDSNPLPLSALGPAWERPSERRPVLPAWVTDVAHRKAATAWAVDRGAHTVAFHAARVPLYCARLAGQSPRGPGRTTVALAQWAVDAESAGLRRESAWGPAGWSGG